MSNSRLRSRLVDESVFAGTVRTVAPTGTSSDAANIQAALNAMAGVGEVRLGPGTFDIRSSIDLSGLAPVVIVGHPNTVLKQTLTTGSGIATVAGIAGSHSEGAQTTLASNATIGSNQVSLTASLSLATGDYIIVKQNAAGQPNRYRQSIFKVLARSGAGPYTVTLDRPVRFPFTSATAEVFKATPLVGHRIYGNGMRMSGVGSRYIELIGCYDVIVNGVRFVPDDGNVDERFISMDVGSWHVGMEDLHGDGAGAVPLGFSAESAEDAWISDSSVRRCTSAGIILQDTIDAVVRDTTSTDHSGANAIMVSMAVSNTLGSLNTVIRGGTYSHSAVGVACDTTTDGLQVFQATISDNTKGVNVPSGAKGLNLQGCYIQRNVTGIEVAAGGKVKTFGCDWSGGTNAQAILVDGTMVDSGSTCESATTVPGTSIALVRSGGYLHVTGAMWTVQAAAAAVYCAAGGRAYVGDSYFALSANNAAGVLTNGAGAVATVERTDIVDTGVTGTIGLYNATGTIRKTDVTASTCDSATSGVITAGSY